MRTIVELFGIAKGLDVFILGTGPSMAGFDWGRLKGRFTIALNYALTQFPIVPDIHLFNDCNGDHPLQFDYLRHPYDERTRIVCQKTGWEYFAINKAPFADRVFTYFNRGPDCDMGQELACTHTVSAPAIMLAWKLGARSINLLGCDGYRVGCAEHAYEGVNPEAERQEMLERSMDSYEHSQVRKWLEICAVGLPDGGVWNLSPHSVLVVWPKRTLEVALAVEPAAATA